jgi:hypothetical protein
VTANAQKITVNAMPTRGSRPPATTGVPETIRMLRTAVRPTAQEAFVAEITPEMAEEMLTNPLYSPAAAGLKDRHHNESASGLYARLMAEGKWHLNGEAIVFDDKGRRLNGQHRLHACVKADKPFLTWVVVGVDPAAFASFDRGKNRTPGDVLGMAGYTHAHTMAAALAYLQRYDDGSAGVPHKKGDAGTPEELLSLVGSEYDAEALSEALQWNSRMTAKPINWRLAPPSVTTAAYYLTMESKAVPKAKVAEFWDQVVAGVGLTPGSITLKLRRVLEGFSLRSGPGRIAAAPHIKFAYILKAFNFFATDTKRETLAFRDSSEAFPSVVGRPPRYAEEK